MKRKILLIGGGLLAGLAILCLLATLGAPLLERLGVPVYCIQGEWPDLRITSCPEPGEARRAVTPLPDPTPNPHGPIPLIFDDDGSPDGVIALLYFLNNPQYDVRAVTVSCGEAHPQVFAGHMLRLLAGLGRSDIPVGAGRETPLLGSNAFPEPWRQASDEFWGVELPAAAVSAQAFPAAELIVETLSQADQPVQIFVGGNHTNLAEALRLAPEIAGNIRGVDTMGGSLYAPGNIASDWPEIDNQAAEWNIWVDPLAAEEVFTAGLVLHMTPLDATSKLMWTETDAQAWARAGSPVGVLAAELLNWMLQNWSPEGVYIWDLVAAVDASDERLCPPTLLAVNVLTGEGPEQGRTQVVEGSPNVSACLQPELDQIKRRAEAILGR